MADTTLQIRTNAADKEAAGKVLARYGVNYSQLVNGLLKEVIRTQSVPFAVDLKSVAAVQLKSTEKQKAEIPETHGRHELSLDELDMVAAAGDGTSVESSVREQFAGFCEKLSKQGYSARMILAELQQKNPQLYKKAQEFGLF